MPEGGYDRVVSVEMLEHVGKEFMDGYFGAINSLLNPTHGIMVIQGITVINQVLSLPPLFPTLFFGANTSILIFYSLCI
jgi:cyclopropane fatty-acyl-phospholipid synthase-like methyltransferase